MWNRKCKHRLLDQFVQNWQISLSDSSKALNYRIFKTKFQFEEYFNILNIGDAIRLCRFRTTNPYLPIETGRWRNIDRENSYCNLCNCQKLGDEYHYVLECSALDDKRKQLLPKYFMKIHNVVKFFELLSNKKTIAVTNIMYIYQTYQYSRLYSWLTHCCSLTYVYFVNSLVMLLLYC
jgi:hypothetical protein